MVSRRRLVELGSGSQAAGSCGALLLILAVCAAGFGVDPARNAEQALSLEESLEKARIGGKYSMLLRQIKVAEDRKTYSDFRNLDFSKQRERGDFIELPHGYCVYVAPYWYIWRDLTLETKRMRPYGPEQVTGPPNTLQAGDASTAWASTGTADFATMTVPQTGICLSPDKRNSRNEMPRYLQVWAILSSTR